MLLLAAPSAAQAQDGAPPPPLTAEQALANAAARYTTRTPPPEPCPESTADVIVVCRQFQDWGDGGLLSPTEQAIADGVMPPGQINAPDFAGPSTNVVARGCFIPPCPGEPALLIDLKAIPEAPPGSAAARYAGD